MFDFIIRDNLNIYTLLLEISCISIPYPLSLEISGLFVPLEVTNDRKISEEGLNYVLRALFFLIKCVLINFWRESII